VLHAARHGILIFGTRQHKIRTHPKAFQPLPHDVLEQLPGPFPADRIGVENSNAWRSDGPSLEDRPAFFQYADDGFQLFFGDGEGCALDGGDALSRYGVAEVQRSGDDYAGGAVDLLE
jgi:hypothetical protein